MIEKPEPVDYPTLRVPVTASKRLLNGRLEAGAFRFALRDGSHRVVATVSNEADGRIVFPDRSFSREVRNYLFTVSELPGDDPDISHDDTVYTLRISTTAVGGVLEAQVDVLKDGIPYAGELLFTNTRELPPTGDSMPARLALLAGLALLLLGASLVLHRNKRGAGKEPGQT